AIQWSNSLINAFILSLASVLLVLLPSIELASLRESYFSSHSITDCLVLSWSFSKVLIASSSRILVWFNNSNLCNNLLILFSKESTISTNPPISVIQCILHKVNIPCRTSQYFLQLFFGCTLTKCPKAPSSLDFTFFRI